MLVPGGPAKGPLDLGPLLTSTTNIGCKIPCNYGPAGPITTRILARILAVLAKITYNYLQELVANTSVNLQ